jgi:hypothetical protein
VEIISQTKPKVMSKDKGQKNQKKSPADKSSGKTKEGSSYKNEGKISTTSSVIEAFHPKLAGKTGKNS